MFFIQNLQKKPEGQKKIILFFVVGIMMALIFIVWFFQFKSILEIKTKKTEEVLTPLSELSNNVVDIYKNSAEKIKKIKRIIREKE